MYLVEQDVVEVPSRSNKKVPFYFLGEALFGAISLAILFGSMSIRLTPVLSRTIVGTIRRYYF
jgi:hypothetical protein